MAERTAGPSRWRAHAKLTLSLRVTGRRADGYHLIDAEMVSLDLHDVLLIDPGGTGLATTGPFAAGVPTDRTNIVARALDLLGVDAHVTIDKRVPHGGGLGGGSADAAATLHWAAHPSSPTDLERVAALGADVPFCLVGGRARVTGIGEIVEPLPYVERTFTVVSPPLHVATPAVYRAWDDLGGPTADGPNDLEQAACVVEPELRAWRAAIEQGCGRVPTLAGSGASWFVEGEHDGALTELVDEGAGVVVARTVPWEVASNRAT